jgi:uncharacterized protein
LACGLTFTISSIMSEPADSPRVASCPICRKPVVDKFRPFCSKRCADVDLNRWLSGVYAVPVVEQDESSDGDPPPDRG